MTKNNRTPADYRNGGQGCIDWIEDKCYLPVTAVGSDISQWTAVGKFPEEYNYLWGEQCKILREALEMKDDKFIHRLIVLCWMRGEGKCSGFGTKVLMYDGSVKTVENVLVGDQLMGDDNTPRNVLSLARGREEMFEVMPMRGEPMVLTGDHVLSLKRRRSGLHKRGKPIIDIHAGKIVDITVNDFKKKSKSWKGLHLLYKVPINWTEQDVPIDPYYLGMWAGDGDSNGVAITTIDKEVVGFLYGYAESLGMHVSVYDRDKSKANKYRITNGQGKNNPILNLLRENNLINNKHIPEIYKINSREVRLQVLAGLVDSDGHINRNSVEIIQKSKTLSEDIVFLARSLGFHVKVTKCKKGIKSTGFVGEYYRMGISGDCSIIPTRIKRKKAPKRSNWKDVLVTGIRSVRSIGEDNYYGFMLDGNHRYVSGDFTVTHNSLLACLIQLWKFFNWPRQQIVLGANSKEQTKFVHYDIMRDIILNSPPLLNVIGLRNVQEKDIRLKDSKGRIVSQVRALSTSTGIVSNITGYTFSEMFNMKKPKFFVELSGSTRNIPNALGVIDSTVSEKTHQLYKLYEAFKKGTDKTIYFSHRQSQFGVVEDFWNPHMTSEQLLAYKEQFPAEDFDRFFKNTWSAGERKQFTEAMVEATRYIGANGKINNHGEVMGLMKRKVKVLANDEDGKEKGLPFRDSFTQLDDIERALSPVEKIYNLGDKSNGSCMISNLDLAELGKVYNTGWAIMAGFDRSDPMKTNTSARTIFTLVAKGLPGSLKNPTQDADENFIPKYIYFLIHLVSLQQNTLEEMKSLLDEAHREFDGVDKVTAERWGMWDLAVWCEEHDVPFEAVYPNYNKQRDAFSELYILYRDGRFKTPVCPVAGTKKDDILYEEAMTFIHDPDKKWYGSPEKKQKYGVQDDCMFSLGWNIYGGRELGLDDLRTRNSTMVFGEMFGGPRTVGRYF